MKNNPTALECVQKLAPYQPGKPIDELAREFSFELETSNDMLELINIKIRNRTSDFGGV